MAKKSKGKKSKMKRNGEKIKKTKTIKETTEQVEEKTTTNKVYLTRSKKLKMSESLLELLTGENISESSEETENINNFEYDFRKIKRTLMKTIEKETGYSPDSKRLMKIQKAIDDTFEMLSRAKKEALSEIAESQPRANLWKVGLGPDEIERLEPILNKIRDEIKSERTVTIIDILDSPLSDKHKSEALQMYDIILNIEEYTNEWIAAIKNLKEFIKSNTLPKDILEIVGKNISLKDRILSTDISPKDKAVIYEKYLQLEKLKDQSDTTASNLRDWIEHALKIPFNTIQKSRLESLAPDEALIHIKNGLDNKLFGMNEVKEQILCIFNNRLKNNSISGMKLCMLGSPGVGKTEIARSLAEILDLPFVQISLGGLIDSTILSGSNQTWIGGSPGKIIKALQQLKCKNGIVFFDEIDKLAKSPGGKEVQAVLLHILDPTQNSEFRDNYMGHELTFDLSKIFFITAANDTSELDPAILSRIPPIKIPDYTQKDKKEIVKHFIIPKLLKKSGIEQDNIIFPDSSIDYLLSKLEKSGGIRNEEDAFSTVIYRLGILLTLSYVQQKEMGLSFAISLKSPVTVDNSLIDHLYKKVKDPLPMMYN